MSDLMPMVDLVGLLVGLDEGTLTEQQEIDLFQDLVDSGLAWSLQGRIGRQAADMLADGTISHPVDGTISHPVDS